MRNRIVSNLTLYEVGQDLIDCADTIGEKIKEIENSGFTEQAKALHEAKKIITNCFNKNHGESHGFGI
jgi:hypothetical protein